MSVWKDIGSILPPEATTVVVRRFPSITPVLYGDWNLNEQSIFCGPQDWMLPWYMVTHWRPLSYSQPDWPAPPLPPGKWRDVYWYPPSQGDHCWVRRYEADCAALQGIFDSASHSFAVGNTPLKLPWWAVLCWKPVSAPPVYPT